jgi:hypothetical protein
MPPLMKLIFPLLPNSFVFKPITTLDYSSFSSPTQAHTPSSPTSWLLYNFTTPMVGGQSLSSVCPPFADITLYFSLVGALQYLTSIRHAWSYSLSTLSVSSCMLPLRCIFKLSNVYHMSRVLFTLASHLQLLPLSLLLLIPILIGLVT